MNFQQHPSKHNFIDNLHIKHHHDHFTIIIDIFNIIIIAISNRFDGISIIFIFTVISIIFAVIVKCHHAHQIQVRVDDNVLIDEITKNTLILRNNLQLILQFYINWVNKIVQKNICSYWKFISYQSLSIIIWGTIFDVISI